MLVPLSWLREYVAFDLSPQALAEELTLRGLEVSATEVTGADWTDVVVGRLLSVERHPNADKLWLTSVDAGTASRPKVMAPRAGSAWSCSEDRRHRGPALPLR